jgi:hypothetical protein
MPIFARAVFVTLIAAACLTVPMVDARAGDG